MGAAAALVLPRLARGRTGGCGGGGPNGWEGAERVGIDWKAGPE
jgi:hypothetical protein